MIRANKVIQFSIFFFGLTIICQAIAFGQTDGDLIAEKEKVRMALLDYIEGIYNVEPKRIERSVSKDLVKVGYYRPRTSDEYSLSPMSYEELINIAETLNLSGWIPDDAPKKIEIYDVSVKVAVAKVEAIWGFDYMHLGKDEAGNWKIMQILWQSYPKARDS